MSLSLCPEMPVRVVYQLAATREELRPHVLSEEGSGMRQLQGLRVWEQRLLLRWLGRIGEVDSDELLFLSGHLTGNWTIQTGQGGFVSPPKAKLLT